MSKNAATVGHALSKLMAYSPKKFMERSSARRLFLGKELKTQIGALYQELDSTNKHFIRCVKPNNERSKSQFDEKLVHNQMAVAGIIHKVILRKQGPVV